MTELNFYLINKMLSILLFYLITQKINIVMSKEYEFSSLFSVKHHLTNDYKTTLEPSFESTLEPSSFPSSIPSSKYIKCNLLWDGIGWKDNNEDCNKNTLVQTEYPTLVPIEYPTLVQTNKSSILIITYLIGNIKNYLNENNIVLLLNMTKYYSFSNIDFIEFLSNKNVNKNTFSISLRLFSNNIITIIDNINKNYKNNNITDYIHKKSLIFNMTNFYNSSILNVTFYGENIYKICKNCENINSKDNVEYTIIFISSIIGFIVFLILLYVLYHFYIKSFFDIRKLEENNKDELIIINSFDEISLGSQEFIIDTSQSSLDKESIGELIKDENNSFILNQV